MNRRQFIAGLAACSRAFAFRVRPRRSDYIQHLYSKNYQTAIGLGDEPVSIVDRYGQLKSDDANGPGLANAAKGGSSRNVQVLIEVGDPPRPIRNFGASQWLEEGYLPVVHTRIGTAEGNYESILFSSDAGGLKADYLGINAGRNSFRIKLLCPTATFVSVNEGMVRSSTQILAMVPVPGEVRVRNAKYNCLTAERNTRVFPSAVAWEGLPRANSPASLDPAFAGARTAAHTLEYVFPVTPGRTYHVFLGIGNPAWLVGNPEYFKAVRLSADEQSENVHFRSVPSGGPAVCEFTVKPAGASITVRSEGLEGSSLLSGVWIFDRPVSREQVISGKLNNQARYYVRCGREPGEDIASSVDLLYDAPGKGTMTWIQLPYSLHPDKKRKTATVSPEVAWSATRERWNSFLDSGAQFRTGISRLDNLYKTSVINLFLLRTKYPRQGGAGQDIYAVKPGATIYDSFWYRDGSYIIAAIDVAGYAAEAEKSLCLFTNPDLQAAVKHWGQHANGLWESPGREWDSQGQALWALVHHYELTGDVSWLRGVYRNIRRGALWIKEATRSTQALTADGEKPITWGLLPKGVSEDTGTAEPAFVYEHDFWGILGMRQALKAARTLGKEEDVNWMREIYAEFNANLLASIRRAYRTVGRGEFIPGDPFDAALDINGDIAAVYPARFLDARDPMVTSSLERIARHSREGLYTWFKTLNNGDMWTYMTADWAMCYMLRDELDRFQKLFMSYANHASPTNNWSECIYSDSRLGTGDTPHGWAAASYVLLHRNSLVYENENSLELCWGVAAEWLGAGAHVSVQGAPTEFGKLDFDLKRVGSMLTFDHKLVTSSTQPRPGKIRLHIAPATMREIRSIRINGATRSPSPRQSIFLVD